MFDLLFSLQFVWISSCIIALSILIGFLCAYLQSHLLQLTAGVWLVEHIYCPLAKTLILMCMTLLLFPLMVKGVGYTQVSELFVDTSYLTNMMNILFVSGLLFTFFPLLSHPAVAMSGLGCIATAILLYSYYNPAPQQDFSFLPDIQDSLKILILIIASYWANRWVIDQISTYIDNRYIVTGSKALVSDISYLILQIPIMLAYAHSLHRQFESGVGSI